VKELKVHIVFAKPAKSTRKWNPVKELKGWEYDPYRRLSFDWWNPVKELKVEAVERLRDWLWDLLLGGIR